MKRILTLAAMTLATTMAHAATPVKAITNYYPGTLIVTNVPGGTATARYVCVPLSILTNASYTASFVTNDARALTVCFVRVMKDGIAAKLSTNRFTSFSIGEQTQWESATNRIISWTILEGQVFTITPTYGSY